MDSFLIALFVSFISELGDKSQMAAITMTTQYGARLVVLGLFMVTLSLQALNTFLGLYIGRIINLGSLKIFSAVCFIGLGLWDLKAIFNSQYSKKGCFGTKPLGVIIFTFILFGLGDRSMFYTISLAATHPIIPVWLGSTFGAVISDTICVLFCKTLKLAVWKNQIRLLSAIFFIIYGLTVYFASIP